MRTGEVHTLPYARMSTHGFVPKCEKNLRFERICRVIRYSAAAKKGVLLFEYTG